MSPYVFWESLVPSSRFAASARTAKNVPDHRGARAGASRGFIVESGKADTYSRNLARIRFTPASVNLRPPGRSQRRLAHELEILRQGGGGAVSGSIGEIQKHLEAVKDLIVEGRK